MMCKLRLFHHAKWADFGSFVVICFCPCNIPSSALSLSGPFVVGLNDQSFPRRLVVRTSQKSLTLAAAAAAAAAEAAAAAAPQIYNETKSILPLAEM
jgi:hypothetical protein